MGESDQLPPEPDMAGDIRIATPHQWRITLLHALILSWLVLCLMGHAANAQAVRYDYFSSTVNSACAPGAMCPLLVIPATAVNFCTGSGLGVANTAGTVVTATSGPSFTGASGTIQINGTGYQISTVVSSTILVLTASAGTQTGAITSTLSGCLAAPATSYTNAGAGTACPTTAQITPEIGGACSSTADGQGNYGGWFTPGLYYYYLTTPATTGGRVVGPYPISIGASAGCPSNATCDANYATIKLADTAAGSGSLYCTRAWNGLTTETLSSAIIALAGCKLQPASGQSVTLTTPPTFGLQQVFDIHLGGTIVLPSTIQNVPPQWFAVCDGSTVQTAQLQAWIGSAKSLFMPNGPGCVYGASLQTSANGQIIGGSGQGVASPNSGGTSGTSSLVAASGFTGPMIIARHFNVQLSGIELNGNGNAVNGLYVACGSGNYYANMRAHNATGAGIYIAPTSGAAYSCADTGSGGQSSNATWINTTSDNNAGAGFATGIGTPGATQNIMMGNNFVSNGAQGMLLRGVTGWSIYGGTYGGNSGCGIQYSLSGDAASVAGMALYYPDVESNNTGSTCPGGGQVQFGPVTSENSIYTNLDAAFPDADVTGTDTQYLASAAGLQVRGQPGEGSECALSLYQYGLGQVFCAASTPTSAGPATINTQSMPGIQAQDYPMSPEIQLTGLGANTGDMWGVSNTQGTTCALTSAIGLTVPRGCEHATFATSAAGILLTPSPLPGEHHELCSLFAGNTSLNVQGDWYLNLVGGSVTGNQVNLFTAVNQCLTLRFNGFGGYVSTSGTAVTWLSGQKFLTSWGGQILIGNTVYTISTCSTTISCTLTGSAGTQASASYTGPGSWDVVSKNF